MANSCPKISVIIPTYNRAAYLATAVESVRRQDYPALEIIIVDDGSTDDTSLLVSSLGPNVRYAYQANQGPAAARNRGLAVADGEIIAFLDTDDVWPEKRLLALSRYFDQDRSVKLVLGYTQLQKQHTAEGGCQFLSCGQPIVAMLLGAGLFRRSAFNWVGTLDTKLRVSDDVDWYLRAMEAGLPMRVIPDIALYYRWHESNLTHDVAAVRSSLFQALKMSLDRRRRLDAGRAAPLAIIPGMETYRCSQE